MKNLQLFCHVLLATTIITAVVTPAISQNAVPLLINYEGELRDPTTGAPVADSSYDMLFRIYNVETAGSALWEGTHTAANGNAVQVANGVFSVILGSGTGNALAASVFNGPDRWLEMQVGAETLSPRQRITSAAFSIVSENSRLLNGSDSSSFASATHSHGGADITSGTVAHARIDAAIARDSEIVPTVLANDGTGSTLDADLLDGSDSTAFASAAHGHDGGDIATGTVAEARIDAAIARDSEILPAVLANDGTGSGLDADTVDGVQGADLEESAEIDADISAHAAIADAHHTKTTSFAELTDTATDSQIPAGIARDSEVSTAIGTHAATADAHHAKTTSFTELADTAAEAQIPGTIARDSEVTSEITAHAGIADAHHARYTDTEAVSAMGTNSDTNPLNHDKTTSLPWGNITSIPAGFADGIDNDSSGASWSLTGNSGTSPGVNFLGTTDGYALDLRVGNARALRLEPNATSPNLIGGYDGNNVAAGVFAATIGGGGSSLNLNRVVADYGTIAGGANNEAHRGAAVGGGTANIGSGEKSTVGGGQGNTASGWLSTIGGGFDNEASNNDTTVGGGKQNTASGLRSTVSGGELNEATEHHAMVGGGYGNQALNSDTTIGGGRDNTASGLNATIGGGAGNIASSDRATIAGGETNTASAWATTVGGGFQNFAGAEAGIVGGGRDNRVTDNYGAIGGGNSNQAGDDVGTRDDAAYATVAGGVHNLATGYLATIGGGFQNEARTRGTVSGGEQNLASGYLATIGGGFSNESGDRATVSGGELNLATGGYSAIAGGRENRVTDNYGAIAGGQGNLAGSEDADPATAQYATVGGGWQNTAGEYAATVGGGERNTASGQVATVGGGVANTASRTGASVSGGSDNNADGIGAAVGGGFYNKATANYATIAGGGPSDPLDPLTNNRVFDEHGTIGGGGYNRAGTDDGDTTLDPYATVGGGYGNTASSWSATVGGGARNKALAWYATVAGGGPYLDPLGNRVFDTYGTIGGGGDNLAGSDDGDSWTAIGATVGGGLINKASGGCATVGGGGTNTASGVYATVPGGLRNDAKGHRSFAAGTRAIADGAGSFVWGDSEDFDVHAWGANEFVVRATGGYWLFTGIDASGSPTSGATLAAGDGSWDSYSDRNAKANFIPVHPRAVLEKVAALPISTWNYVTQDPSIRHMGPMAQDLYAAFGLGSDDKHIGTIDADGVSLAAIQGLHEIVEEKDAKISSLEERIEALETLVKKLAESKAGGE